MKPNENPDRHIDEFLRPDRVPDAPAFRERTLARLREEASEPPADNGKILRFPWLMGVSAAAAAITLLATTAVLLQSPTLPQPGHQPSAEVIDSWTDPLTAEMFLLAEDLSALGSGLDSTSFVDALDSLSATTSS